MSFLTEWITNIILFILLAIILDLLLPNSKIQRYAKMVIGLLLIIIILNPVLSLFSINIEKAVSSIDIFNYSKGKDVENLIEFKKKEIQASNRAYILEQMAVQLESQVEKELIDKYQFEIQSIKVEFNDEGDEIVIPNDIRMVAIHLSPLQSESVSSSSSNETVKEVEVVSILVSRDTEKLQRKENHNDPVQQFLANKWGLSEEQILITSEGGREW